MLWREANVHKVPIAHDINTAACFINAWAKGYKSQASDTMALEVDLEGINDQHRVLAMIAHDQKKMEICRFAITYAEKILEYDYYMIYRVSCLLKCGLSSQKDSVLLILLRDRH